MAGSLTARAVDVMTEAAWDFKHGRPMWRHGRPTVAVWTPAQTGAFLDFAGSDRLYAYYYLLVFRGPRRGEGVGLKWTDLDLETGTIEIREQIVQLGWETETTTPKADSEGTGVLDSPTVEVLRAHRRRQQQERDAWGGLWLDTGHVFTVESGGPLHPDFVSRHFIRLMRWANELRLGSQGRAVRDVRAALGVTEAGSMARRRRLRSRLTRRRLDWPRRVWSIRTPGTGCSRMSRCGRTPILGTSHRSDSTISGTVPPRWRTLLEPT